MTRRPRQDVKLSEEEGRSGVAGGPVLPTSRISGNPPIMEWLMPRARRRLQDTLAQRDPAYRDSFSRSRSWKGGGEEGAMLLRPSFFPTGVLCR